MNGEVYKNLEKLTISELLTAIKNVKEQMKNMDDETIENGKYLEALFTELDKRG